MAEPTVNDMMSAYALDAVDLARTRFGVALDFSEESINALEGILDRLHASLPTGMQRAFRRGPTQEQIDQMAKIWGGYLGKVSGSQLKVEPVSGLSQYAAVEIRPDHGGEQGSEGVEQGTHVGRCRRVQRLRDDQRG